MRKFYLSALLCLMAIGANGQTKLDLGGRAQLRQQRLLQAQERIAILRNILQN